MVRIGLGQINPIIGDIKGNVGKIAQTISEAESLGVEMLAFPEVITIGYPANDLLYRPEIIRSNVSSLEDIGEHGTNLESLIVGFVRPRTQEFGWDIDRQHLANSYAIFEEGQLLGEQMLDGETLFEKLQDDVRNPQVGIGDKICLPNYGVYDDMRHFVPGENVKVFNGDQLRYGVVICEDLWYKTSDPEHPVYPFRPVERLAQMGAEFVFVLNTSAYHVGKEKTIEKLVRSQALTNNVGIGYVNIWGSNDKIISSGHSLISDNTGQIIARGKGFEDDLVVVDYEPNQSISPAIRHTSDDENRYRATVLGTRDYITKCGFEKAVIGVSGGIDSAVSLAITADAIGAENVLAVLSPSRYTDDRSTKEAQKLCENLGVDYRIIPIEQETDEGWVGVIPEKNQRIDRLYDREIKSVVHENMQAMDRMSILRSIANEENRLVIGTSNKVELAFGYFTLCGDGQSDLLIIGDWYKGQIYDFAKWYNQERGDKIPEFIIDRPPSAELAEGQVDPWQYVAEDEFVRLRVEEYKSAEELYTTNLGLSQETVDKYCARIDFNEHKRFRAGYILKVSPVAFGEDRRINTAKRINL